jgi:effector-binding domain-containing protein
MDSRRRSPYWPLWIAGGTLLAATPATGPFEIVPVEAQVVAYQQRTGPVSGIGDAIQELRAWAEMKGVKIAGPASVLFYTDPGPAPDATLFWEARLPLALDKPGGSPPAPGGVGVIRSERIRAAACGELRSVPGGRGVEGDALREWIRGQGYAVNGPRIETYLDGLGGEAAQPVRMRLCLPVSGPR